MSGIMRLFRRKHDKRKSEVAQNIPAVIPTTDLFLSHDWGRDGKGRNNHQRVKTVNKYLQRAGYRTWLDEEQMEGVVRDSMCEGLDKTSLVLIFVTQNYMNKVNGGNAKDNCKLECNYAFDKDKKVLCITMDDYMSSPGNWDKQLKMMFGGHLFVKLNGDVGDRDYLKKQMDQVEDQLRRKGITPSGITDAEIKDKNTQELCNDDTDHCSRLKGSTMAIYCHHSNLDNPSDILDEFKWADHVPAEFKYRLYENGIKEHHTIESLNTEFLDKFQNVFCKDIERKHWLLTNLNVDGNHHPEYYKFCNMISRWAINKGLTFLFTDYDLEKHLEQMSFNVGNIKRELEVHEKDDSTNRLLLFIAETRILFTIRCVNSTSDSDVESRKRAIVRAIKRGQNDIKLISSVHFDALQNSNVCLVSLVASEHLSSEELDRFEHCSQCFTNLLITNNHLRDEKSLARRLDVITENCIQLVKCSKGIENPKDTFLRLASQIWGVLSIRDMHLPSLCTDESTGIVRVHLNQEQRIFIQLKYRYVILSGPYGSGKSFLAQIKFKELVMQAGEEDYIYFIFFSKDSLYTHVVKSNLLDSLHHELREEQVNIMNSDEYARKYGFETPVNVSDVLEDVNERHATGNQHVIVDELDGSTVTKEEGERVNTAIKRTGLNYVLLVTQSLRIMREKVTKDGQIHKIDGYRYEETGMRCVTLNLVMRNPTKVNQLSRIAKKTFVEYTNKFYERKPITDAISETVSVGTDTDIDTAGTTENITISEKEIVKEGESSQTADKRREDDFEHQEEKATEPVANLDYLWKVFTEHSSNQCTGNILQSTFDLPGQWQDGHNIPGPTPQLVYPFPNCIIDYDNVNRSENIARMYFALKDIVRVESHVGDLAIISFEKLDAQLFQKVLESMGLKVVVHAPALFSSTKKLVDLANVMKDHILVTDHVGARGLEVKRLIVSLNVNEIHLQQYVVEALTRCTRQLYLFVLNKRANRQEGEASVLEDLLQQWRQQDLIDEQVVHVCSDDYHHSGDLTVTESCSDGNGRHRIHTWHGYFQECNDVQVMKDDVQCDVTALQQQITDSGSSNKANRTKKCDEILQEFDARGVEYMTEVLTEDKDMSALQFLAQYRSNSITLRDDEGKTPMIIAAEFGNVLAIQMLLENGASYEERDKYGCTPALRAAWRGKLNAFKYLIQRGANPLDVDKDGSTILHSSAAGGHVVCVEYILDTYPSLVEVKNTNGYTVLHYAAQGGSVQVITTLITQHQADVHARTTDIGATPLIVAARCGMLDAVKVLLQHGASINDVMNDGCTSLYMAVQFNHPNAVAYFLEQHPDLIERTKNGGYTPLHVAAHHGFPHLVKLILSKGANMNTKSDDGSTPLDMAKRNRKEACVLELTR